jgi:hypothetical protein
VCARDFATCESWKQGLEQSFQRTAAIPDGGQAEVTLSCGDYVYRPDFYPPDLTLNPLIVCEHSNDCYPSAQVKDLTCVIAQVDYTGGTATSAHYTGQGDERNAGDGSSGLGAGDIAAIVLGAVLLVGIVVIVVLLVRKVLLCRGKQVEATP